MRDDTPQPRLLTEMMTSARSYSSCDRHTFFDSCSHCDPPTHCDRSCHCDEHAGINADQRTCQSAGGGL